MYSLLAAFNKCYDAQQFWLCHEDLKLFDSVVFTACCRTEDWGYLASWSMLELLRMYGMAFLMCFDTKSVDPHASNFC